MYICKNCKETFDNKVNFCSNCGERVYEISDEPVISTYVPSENPVPACEEKEPVVTFVNKDNISDEIPVVTEDSIVLPESQNQIQDSEVSALPDLGNEQPIHENVEPVVKSDFADVLKAAPVRADIHPVLANTPVLLPAETTTESNFGNANNEGLADSAAGSKLSAIMGMVFSIVGMILSFYYVAYMTAVIENAYFVGEPGPVLLAAFVMMVFMLPPTIVGLSLSFKPVSSLRGMAIAGKVVGFISVGIWVFSILGIITVLV